MITIKLNIDRNHIKDTIKNPILFNLTYGEVFTLEQFKDYQLEESEKYIYLEVLWDHEIVGCFQLIPINRTTIQAHIAIRPKYWGSQVPLEASTKGLEWLKSNTPYKTLLVCVPVKALHVHKFISKLRDFTCCGNIPNGVSYNKELQDLVLYTTYLN